MTSIQHHVVTQAHSATNHLDNNLDALLDDLQTSVTRPGGPLALTAHNGALLSENSLGGHINLPPGATGYREVTTTVTRETNGIPTTSREYQIEYLNPANSVTVLDDKGSNAAAELLKNAEKAGHQVQSYQYSTTDYKYSKTTTDKKVSGYGGPSALQNSGIRAIDSKSYYPNEPASPQDSSQYSKTERSGTTNVSKNLNELDMLLRELNTPPPSGGPGDSRTTPRREHVQAVETRIERSPGRYNESSSTMPKRSGSSTRETTIYTEKSQNQMNRAQSPTISHGTPKSSGKTINIQREYNTMESRSHSSRRDSPGPRNRSAEMSPTLRRRTPSPSSGEFRPANFSNYPIAPKDCTPTRTVTSKSYNYTSTGTSGRRTPSQSFDDPQPYRSPSPVSFPQRRSPSPVRKSLNRSDSGRSVSYQVSPPGSENPTVITYKYSSHSREQNRYPGGGYDERDRDDSLTRPFPTSTPVPGGEQSPPKKLDDLMASFQDHESRNAQGGNYSQGSGGEYIHRVEYSKESHNRHGGDLQRSPSFEKNLRPSDVKYSQAYSQEGHQYQQREHYQQSQHQQYQQNQYQQRDQPGSYQKEFQRREEYHTRDQYPGQFSQRQQQEQYQREQYQQNQYQKFHQNQGSHQKEQREQQYQQNQRQYQQNQQYQYHQQQQYQHQSSPGPVNESMASSQAYRSASSNKSVAGPPVYYPPGVELFTKKEEALLKEEQSSGKKKSKGKSKDKSKEKGKGKSGVPVCLPVCCAVPCTIL